METQYKLIKVIKKKQSKFPVRKLIEINLGDRTFVASLDAFGFNNFFDKNVAKMQKQYSHPKTGKTITFREPTTAESILVASYDFEKRAKPKILDSNWLQLGRIVKTSEGVFANPPKDAQGNPITDEQILKSYLNRIKPVKVKKGKIYIVPDSENLKDFSFADYNSFNHETPQYTRDFVKGGLARILEHTQTPEKFREIASKKNYPWELINLFGVYPNKMEMPFERIVSLHSDGYMGGMGLSVGGIISCDGEGSAFGVLDDKC